MTAAEMKELEQLRKENENLRKDNKILQKFRVWYICGEIRVRRAMRGVSPDHQPGGATTVDQ